MTDEGTKVLSAFFADDDGRDPLAVLRPPGRPGLSDAAHRNARATISTIATAALLRVDKHAPGDRRRAASEALAPRLLQAAVAAAKSDRRLTQTDLADVATHVPNLGFSDATTTFLRDEILRPEMMDHLTRDLATRDEMVDVYVASRLAADATSAAADHYLKMLSARLGLEQALTEAVEAVIGEMRPRDRQIEDTNA